MPKDFIAHGTPAKSVGEWIREGVAEDFSQTISSRRTHNFKVLKQKNNNKLHAKIPQFDYNDKFSGFG